jgi:hypothetical protein
MGSTTSDMRGSKSEVVCLQEGTAAARWRDKEAQKGLTLGRVDCSARLTFEMAPRNVRILVCCDMFPALSPPLFEKKSCKQISHFFPLCQGGHFEDDGIDRRIIVKLIFKQ